MENKEELERERLALERQKIEFEREKLNHEKKKLEQLTQIDHSNQIYSPSDKINVVALIAAIAMIISVFLPWAESRASGFGASFSASASGINSVQGILVLLLGLTSVTLIIIKSKFSYIPAIFSVLLAVSIVIGIGSSSMSSFGVSARASFGIGPIVTVASGILQIIFTLITFKKANTGDKFDLKEFVITNQFWILLTFTFLFSFYFLSLETYESFKFLGFLWFLIVTISIYFSYNYLKLNTVKGVYLVGLCSYFFVNRLTFYFGSRFYTEENTAFGVNLESASSVYFKYFTFLFLILFFSALIFDLLKKYKSTLIHGKVEKWTLFFANPKIYSLLMTLLLLLPFLFYSFTRTIISEKDKENFIKTNNHLDGKWFFFNSDSTKIIEFSLSARNSGVEDVYQNNYSDTLNMIVDVYGAFPNNEMFQFNTSISCQYLQKINAPINLGHGITIEHISPEKLILNFVHDSNKSSKITALQNLEKLQEEYYKNKEKSSEQTIVAQFSHVYSDYLGIKLVFISTDGRTFGIPFFENDFGNFDFYNPETDTENIEMRGKLFKLTIMKKYFLNESNDYESMLKVLKIKSIDSNTPTIE